jgi:putative endonuclease
MNKSYYVYIVSSKNDTVIYIGVTNNLKRRVYEHKNKLIEGFTSKYNVSKLIYYEEFDNVTNAIAREKQLKNWHHEWKINLVKKKNPLFKEIMD